MSTRLYRSLLGLTGAVSLSAAAYAQTSDAPATVDRGQHPTGTTGQAASGARKKADHKAAGTGMNTAGTNGAVAPTGPDTNVGTSGETSDLSGSTGASVTFPAATPPPGIAPPGGIPDTGGGEGPNVDGGPH